MPYVEVARAESERGEVVLRARQDAAGTDGVGPVVHELRVNGVFVMDTRETASERALAEAALSRCPAPRAVLVGGLGLGFTVQAVLADRRVEQVTAVELEPALVGWLRDGTVPHGPQLLADGRLSVVEADVAAALAEAHEAAYDVVLLDVDNGPGQLVHEANAAVYGAAGLSAVRRVLRPGGVLAVWSAHEAPDLVEGLSAGFAAVETVGTEVLLQDRAERYLVYVATR